jgi:uncharacterized protein (DUF1697 family)
MGPVPATTYAALLRAVNVGGVKVRMDRLRDAVTALGLDRVSTYIQSGNVVFAGGGEDPDELASRLEDAVAAEFGIDVPVLVRSADDLARIVVANPMRTRGVDEAKLHVTFLASEPAAERVDAVAPDAGGADGFAVVRREVYLHCPGGYGTTKLHNGFWERKLGVVATTRNWRTVTTLRDLADAASRGV